MKALLYQMCKLFYSYVSNMSSKSLNNLSAENKITASCYLWGGQPMFSNFRGGQLPSCPQVMLVAGLAENDEYLLLLVTRPATRGGDNRAIASQTYVFVRFSNKLYNFAPPKISVGCGPATDHFFHSREKPMESVRYLPPCRMASTALRTWKLK